MNLLSDRLANEGLGSLPLADIDHLRTSLAASEAENSRVRELLATADRLHAVDARNVSDLRESEAALAVSRAETQEGQTDLRASEEALAWSRVETQESQTDLRASEAALASSRAETKEGRSNLVASAMALASSRAEAKEGLTDLLASEVALALSRAEIKEGRTDLLASALALASSRAETKEGQIELLASALALASSRAETTKGQTSLQASAAVNRAMTLANALLVTGEAALRKSEERFRRLVEAAPNAMVMITGTGRIEMVNAQTERLFGYMRSELLGAPVEMLLPPRSRGQHPAMRDGFFAVPAARPMGAGRALFGLRKDGSEVEVEIGLSPIETDEGMMVLTAIVDISDRVRLEAQVRQSQKMHAIGRVTAGVAHDFNNLLLALGGSLELLLESVADRPEALEWGQLALRATLRGKELTDRLLSFSRKQLLKTQPIMIATLFSELDELVSHLFESNARGRTTLVMMPAPEGLAVAADLAQLEAALINLAVNSRDAMGSGGCLRISAYECNADPAIVAPGYYTVISVADTGCGMDAETLAQACEPFFSTKGLNGTGLGLSMVQGFAQQSGGNVHITSVLGEGTTIDLWLPSASMPATKHITMAAAATTQASGSVLLVDDSEDALVVVSAFLRLAGLQVTSRASGDLALAELATGRRFDAIVTDYAMPGMNGQELLTLAREVDPSVPGMIITGFSDPDLLSGMDGVAVLRKPFNRAEVTSSVQALIAARRAVVTA